VSCNLEYHHKFKIFRRITLHRIWPCNFYLSILLRHSFLKHSRGSIHSPPSPPCCEKHNQCTSNEDNGDSSFLWTNSNVYSLRVTIFFDGQANSSRGVIAETSLWSSLGPNIGYRPSNCHEVRQSLLPTTPEMCTALWCSLVYTF
jgi:hypothetical protein